MTRVTQFVLTRFHSKAAVLAIALILCWAIPAAAQYSAGAGGAATTANSAAGQTTQVTGSVPSGPASNEVLRLTLRDAVTQALKYNLGSIESGENTQIARGERLLALSQLLPQISAGVSETAQQLSLATLGIKNIPNVPPVIGPFAYSLVQANVSSTLFSYESIQRFRSAQTAEQAAKLSYQDILDVVTLIVGNAYLQVIADNSHVEAQEAQVRIAKALYDQAVDQLRAGTVPKIDVTRTEVQLHAEEYNLSVARNDFAIAKLVLARAIGLPLGQQFELADKLPYSDINPPSLDDALRMAYQSRSDFLAGLDSQKAAAQSLAAAKGERYPVVAVNGNYGDVGETFGHSHGVFEFQGGVSVPFSPAATSKATLPRRKPRCGSAKLKAKTFAGRLTTTFAAPSSISTQRKSKLMSRLGMSR